MVRPYLSRAGGELDLVSTKGLIATRDHHRTERLRQRTFSADAAGEPCWVSGETPRHGVFHQLANFGTDSAPDYVKLSTMDFPNKTSGSREIWLAASCSKSNASFITIDSVRNVT